MKKHVWRRLILLALVTGVGLGGGYGAIRLAEEKAQEKDSILSQQFEKEKNEAEPSVTEVPLVEEEEPASRKTVSAVVENVAPAVVSINGTFSEVTYDFWGRGYERESSGSGSGIIVAQGGETLFIVTNHHVVENAKTLEVVFCDGTTAAATVKGTEPENDIAVIAVSLQDVTKETCGEIRIAVLGDSEQLKLGEMVIAIGNALGYGQSTTVGYVSALHREVTMNDGTALQLIQTDVAINPGNSGGALLNARGEVIGINNAKVSSEAVEGMCYAIPISAAIPIINSLLNREVLSEEESAYLGIDGKTITDTDANMLNMPVGVYVRTVEEGSAAEQAGIKVGYVITAVNGRTVATKEDLTRVLSYTRGGSDGTVTVQIIRKGLYEEEELPITFGYKK